MTQASSIRPISIRYFAGQPSGVMFCSATMSAIRNFGEIEAPSMNRTNNPLSTRPVQTEGEAFTIPASSRRKA